MDCPLRIGAIGLNHKTAGLSLRESFARAALHLQGEAGLFFPHAAIVLSTCNRTEIYFSSEDLAECHSDILSFLQRTPLDEPFEHRLYSYFGFDCLSHLCLVASGLDSAIVAETEIQRQVKVAYLRTSEQVKLPSSLHFLFQKALKVGKEVRGRLPMVRGAATLPGVIWDCIRKPFAEPARCRTLFVGHSRINREISDYLQRKGISDAVFCTRHPVSDKLCVSREEIQRWETYDIIICASASPTLLIHDKELDERPRLIFDLSVPRNVDPTLGEKLSLFNIEQLDRLVEQHRHAHREHLDHCRDLIRQNALRLCASFRRKTARAETGLLTLPG